MKLRAGLAAGRWLALAAGAAAGASAAPPGKASPRARYPEAAAACSHHLATPVIEVWLNKCDRPSPGPGVELWGQGAVPGTAIGTATPARIDELRAAGCPVAVLCTSANEYAGLNARLSEAGRAKLLARAARRARPPASKQDGVFLGIISTRD